MREDTKQIRGAVTLANSSALFRRLPPQDSRAIHQSLSIEGRYSKDVGHCPKVSFLPSHILLSVTDSGIFFFFQIPILPSCRDILSIKKKKWSDRDQPIKSWMGGHLERKQPILFKYQLYPVQIRFQENSDQYYIGTYSRIRTKCKCQLIRLCKGEEKKMCWLIIR